MSQEYFNQILEIFKSYANDPESKTLGLVWTEDQVREAFLKHGVHLELCDGRVVGFIFYRVLDKNLFEVDMTMTDKSFVKKGVMQGLFQKLRAQIPKGSEVWLEVHKSNLSAINLYEKQGFDIVGRRPRYYPGGGEAILMNLKI